MRKKGKKIYADNLKNHKKKRRFFKFFNTKFNKDTPTMLKFFGKIFVFLILIFTIMFSILITALTVYVMKATDTESTISLEKDSIIGKEFTNVYGKDANGKFVKLSAINSGIKRIWVDISDIPQVVKDAVVAIEDHKFYKHDGVDFRRTAGAVLNMFLHFWSSNQGGSTITQQLLKNITGDKEDRGIKGISRKVNEIYKAMSLEKKYSKDQILQAYLNIIYVGNGNYIGIKTAARLYFDKDLKDVNLQEAAALAALIRNPGRYNMLKDSSKILNRRNHVLNRMYETGKITKQECENAKKSPVVTKRGRIFKDKTDNYQSYFVDAALNEVVFEYMKNRKIKDWELANEQVKKNGFKIYTTIDVDMQSKLEKEYEKLKMAKNVRSAFVIFDLNGNMKACVGGLGEKKPGDRSSINFATSSNALILPGSTMKAFVYANAIEKNEITYSSCFKDEPFKMVNGKPWPQNFGNKNSNTPVTVKYAVQKSLNTVPTRILYEYGNKGMASFCDFLTDKLHISTIQNPKHPETPGRFETSGMAMGSLVKGIILSEFVNAFQIFANGGSFRKLTTLEKVVDQSGKNMFDLNKNKNSVISKDTSVVVNRLLRNVVLGGGTGVGANLDSMSVESFGKTGTSNDGKNLLFIGGTPKYVAGIWFGSSNGQDITKYGINPAQIWGNIMKRLLEHKDRGKFSNVAAKEQTFCGDSGLLCNPSCPHKERGYYKRDNYLTRNCNLHH